MWQARAEMLAGELAAAREQVRALSAPSREPQAELNLASLYARSSDPAALRRWWQRPLFK
jgi:hypothetical protein